MEKIVFSKPKWAICVPEKGVYVCEYREMPLGKTNESNEYLWNDLSELTVGGTIHFAAYSDGTKNDMEVSPNTVIVRMV